MVEAFNNLKVDGAGLQGFPALGGVRW